MSSNSPIKRSFTRPAAGPPMAENVVLRHGEYHFDRSLPRPGTRPGGRLAGPPDPSRRVGPVAHPEDALGHRPSSEDGERQFRDSPNIVPTTSGEDAGMRTVVVGASSGLGRCIGVGLTKRGAQTALLARRLERLEAAAKEAGPGTRGARLRRHRHRVVPVGHRRGGRASSAGSTPSSTRRPSARWPRWPTWTPRRGGRSSTPTSSVPRS